MSNQPSIAILNKIFENARRLQRTVVLPEGEDVRMLEAARRSADENTAKIVIIDAKKEVSALAASKGIPLKGISLVTPEESSELPRFAALLQEKRKAKGMTAEEAAKLAKDPLFFADLMVETGLADGCLAGAVNSTGNVVKAALYCIGAKEGTVSSYFLMLVPGFRNGEDYSPFVFADCAVVPFPDSRQLSAIASASADSFKKLTGREPKVAMLSYSTKGSAKHENVDKVIEATRLVREKNPALVVDGEFQLDAAVIPSIGKRKAPDSALAGEANVLVFPDLNAGNICYKAVERFAHAVAIGPVMQGLNKPANDLSRGCSTDDIFKMIAITAVSA